MSAKGRGAKVADHELYVTPPDSVLQLLAGTNIPGGRWLEPCAGDGAIIRAVGSVRGDVVWTAAELQKRLKSRLELGATTSHVAIGDFLRMNRADLGLLDDELCVATIGNPPFSLAADFVFQSLKWSQQVFLLLRLNWLGSSRRRRDAFDLCGTPDVFALEQRPSFFNDGGNDATDYGWFRWARGGQLGRLKILRGGE